MSSLSHTDTHRAEARLALGQSVVRREDVLRLEVHGGVSMWPMLRAGDVLDLEPVTPGGIDIGEIVVCQHGGRWVAHRVIEAERGAGEAGWVRCRGDTHRVADAPVGFDRVLGRVVGRKRAGRVTRLDRGLHRQIGWLFGRWGSPLPAILDAYGALRRRVRAAMAR